MTTLGLVWHYVRPPSGPEMRRLVALVSVFWGIVRVLDGWSGLLPKPAFENVDLLPNLIYGVMYLGLGLGLFCTMGARRTRPGRLVAALACGVYLVAGIDLLGVSIGFVTLFVLAYGMLGEALRADEWTTIRS